MVLGTKRPMSRWQNAQLDLPIRPVGIAITPGSLSSDSTPEAITLDGVGPKLVDWLTDKMNEHCDANGLPRPKKAGGGAKRRPDLETASLQDRDTVITEQPKKKARTVKQYIPKPRSGAYAIILALSAQAGPGRGMTKSELQREAQPFCDSSFTVPSDPSKFYTAWKSMDTLLNKELVCVVGRPTSRYLLTEEGCEVARQIRAAEGRSFPVGVGPATLMRTAAPPDFEIPARFSAEATDPMRNPQISLMRNPPRSPNEIVQGEVELVDEVLVRSDSFQDFDPICLPARSFSIQLVLDNREVRTPADRDYISIELEKLGVKPIIRPLPLGDALWVAKVDPLYADSLTLANTDDDGEGKDEILLDYIAERKRLDDLISSIKDGRFREQKFRLRKSGVKHVIYLIEEYSISSERSETYGDSVESAIASMQIVNGFFVKQTSKLDETVRYLAEVTRSLRAIYENRDLNIIPTRILEGCNFLPALESLRQKRPDIDHYVTVSAFVSMAHKSESLTLRDVFLKMLMCIRGVTGEKAIEIQKKWPTPKSLIDAFAATQNDEAKISMLSNELSELIPRKKIAKALSSKIAEVWA